MNTIRLSLTGGVFSIKNKPMNKAKGPVIVITPCIIAYVMSFQAGTKLNLHSFLVIISPLLLILAAYAILKDTRFEYPFQFPEFDDQDELKLYEKELE